ncbi:class I SAM-dependent methyltransferase [Selenomonas sp. TAMA-11512]|uniref:class I SAM-dependent methyltransferase n=1 Tax=Selenomonas sp. TAMA-11512 TaxID=3095337 RepID=UPI0030871D29|nr:class I SAM-dependent methyltransferase [Selenomonas sp. TAMA-11512]
MSKRRELDFSFWDERWRQNYSEREQRIRANPLLDYWDKRARDFSLMRKSNDYDFGRSVYAALQDVLGPDSTMLDIGAGPGSFTIPFAQKIKSVTAIEPSQGMSAILKENAKEAGVENYTVIEELLEDLPQEPSSDFQFDLVAVSLVLWMFQDVWPRIEQMERYAKGHCVIVAGIPDWKHPRDALKSDVEEFQSLCNMLISQGRFPDVRVIDYVCERAVADEIECRKIMYEQYEADLTPEAEEKIRREVEARAKDGMCLITSRSAVIRWNPGEMVLKG